MAISRLSNSTLGNGLPKYQKAWDGTTLDDALVLIGTANFNGGGTIAFENIPQGYQDLILNITIRGGYAASLVSVYGFLNNDTASNYYFINYYSDGGGVSSGRGFTQPAMYVGYAPGGTATTGQLASTTVTYFNYANTATGKPYIAKYGCDQNGGGRAGYFGGYWSGTTGINKISITSDGGGGVSLGGATLYAVKAVGQ